MIPGHDPHNEANTLFGFFAILWRRARFKIEVLGIEQCLMAKRPDMALGRARMLLQKHPDIHNARLAGCVASSFVLIAGKLKPEEVLRLYERFQEDGFGSFVDMYGLGYHMEWALCHALLRVLPQPAFVASVEMLLSFVEQEHPLIERMCDTTSLVLELLGYAATRNGKTGFAGPNPKRAPWTQLLVCEALRRSLEE